MAARGLSLLVQPDQWARCVHDRTALLPDGGVELSWLDPVPAAGAASGCAELPAHSGLAFDRWCRAYRSRPETGRVDVSQRAAGEHSRPEPACGGPLRFPAGLAVDRRQRLYLAEAGTGLVHVIDLWGQRLLRRIAVGRGRPIDVAPDCGRAIVLTSEPALLLIDGRRGPLPGPALVRPCYPGGLVARRIAPGPLVLWRAADGRGVLARPDGTVLAEVDGATDSDCGPAGELVLGGLPGAPLRRFQLAGDALTELEPVEALGYDGGSVCYAPDGRIAFTTAAGYGWTSGSAAVHLTEGSVISYRLDSGGYRTRWGRLFLEACLPAGTEVRARFVSTDDDLNPDPVPASPPARGARAVPDPQATPPLVPQHLLPADGAGACPLYRRPSGTERPWLPATDAAGFATYETPVLAAPGRYLWVQLLLRGTERVSPRVRALRVERPGHDLLTALPRSWSRDDGDADFLQRMLAPAEGMLHELDEWAERRAVLVDPRATPSSALDWLAGFAALTLDQRWPEPARRTLVAEVYPLYRRRGTKAALLRILEIYLGYPPQLVEAWQLRGLAGAVLGTRPGAIQPPAVGGTSAQTGSLGRFAVGGARPGQTGYTASAHRFTLLLRGELTGEQRSVVRAVLDAHKPAHTLVEICELGAGMRVGERLRLDLTSYVGPGRGWAPAIVGQVLIGGDGVVGLPAVGSRLGNGSSAIGQVRVG
ncbi:phage tail protein [Jatrophihabitans sp.]|uniref:phage tail protein n=1 Tax=Jatrophihabitans sp. TaxID=1932789 RepID=UPI002C6CAAB9|nr:phage tail protein [Jatrophihabitans sp.]